MLDPTFAVVLRNHPNYDNHKKTIRAKKKSSCKPLHHVLENCNLHSADCIVDVAVSSDHVRSVEPVALVDGLIRRVGLVTTFRRNGLPEPRVACQEKVM